MRSGLRILSITRRSILSTKTGIERDDAGNVIMELLSNNIFLFPMFFSRGTFADSGHRAFPDMVLRTDVGFSGPHHHGCSAL
jgi:hypothetical protein